MVKSARASPVATRIWDFVMGRLVEDTGAAPFVYAAIEVEMGNDQEGFDYIATIDTEVLTVH